MDGGQFLPMVALRPRERVRGIGSIRALVCWLALSAALPAQQYVFHAFRQAEGLRNLAVNAMATDRQGFLWLATENGVFRFLGVGFQRFGSEQGIGELDALDIVSDPNGAIWVATEENLYRWDGQRFFPAGRNPIPIVGPRRVAVEDAHHLLVVENGQIYRLEHDAEGRMLSYLPVLSGRTLAAMPDLSRVSSLSVVPAPPNGQSIWVGCGKKLYSWQESETGGGLHPSAAEVTAWDKDKGLAEDRWETVMLDRAGTLWAAGIHHVAVLPKGDARFVDRSIPGSDPDGMYGHAPLIEDPQGRILAPTEDGIARWDKSGWRIIGQPNGLEHIIHIAGMAFDAAGDLWFASHGDGLYNWAGYADWEGWSDRQGLPSAVVWAVQPAPGGGVYVGTDKGPASINLRNGSTRPLFMGRRWNFGPVNTLGKDSDGALFAGTLSGAVVRIDPKTLHAELAMRLPSFVMVILQDSSGRPFFATKNGLYLPPVKPAAGSPSSSGRKRGYGLAAPVRVQAVDALLAGSNRIEGGCQAFDGAMWLLGNNRLLRFKNGAWTAPPIDGLPNPLRGSLLALSCASNGAIWVTGDQTGTWRLTFSGQRLRAWQLELPAELRSLAPLTILADRRGWIWLGTDLGLVVWNGQSWRHLTQESGLIWNDINQGGMLQAPDGSLWIGTSGGVSHLLHPERVFSAISLTPALTKFQRGQTSYLGARQITIPWEGPPLEFRLSSPTMHNLSELTLKIKMVGYQQEWMETQTGNATFPRLPPGKFTFMAMVCNPGLNACSVPVRVDIKVLPPWWRTDWFYGLCALAVLLLLAIVIHLYARQLRARSRHLEMLVSDRTRELEASREQLRIQATHDGLTGMLNRVAILRALAAEMDRAQRENRTVVVGLVDLDHFKRINDQYGHLAGDGALRWFSAAVGGAIRAYDHAGRYGGEEFLLVLTEVPREAVEQRLTSLHGAISNLQVCDRGVRVTLNCSMGATVFDPSESSATVESLLAIADQTLYAAKAAGRNRVVFRSPGSANPVQLLREKIINPN